MGGLVLGPLYFPAERAAVLAGFLALMAASVLLGRGGRGEALGGWAWSAAILAFLGARLGFVLIHFDSYRADPASVFAIWQGGFSPLGGAVGFAAASLWRLARARDLIRPAVLASLAALAAWGLAGRLLEGGGGALPEQAALARLDGTPVSPADWKGRPKVVNLWATWCPPCRRETPMMAEVAAASDVEILFVNQGESAATIRAYLAREGILIRPLLDPERAMMRGFGAFGLPTTLFLDAEGRLLFAHMGEISRAQLLEGMERLRAAELKPAS